MNDSVFSRLLQNATSEITARYPEYFAHHPVEVPSLNSVSRGSATRRLLDCSEADVASAVEMGLSHLRQWQLPVRRDCSSPDEISTLLLQSMLDAYVAARGGITLDTPQGPTGIGEVLSNHYVLERVDDEISYFMSRRKARPLLIVSSTGIPLGIWSHLLNDQEIDRRCLVVQSRGSPLLEGGTPQQSSLWQDVEDISKVLRAHAMEQVDILAWCNGSRVAIELARAMPDCIASIALLSPTFHGAVDAALYPSPFEDSLQRVSNLLRRDPDRGRLALHHMNQVTPTGEVSAFTKESARRMGMILRLPPSSLVRELLRPVATATSFQNYAARILDEASYDVRTALAEVRCPMLLIVGTHDAAVNVQAAHDLLKSDGAGVLQVTVLGAGHHIHYLQYPYLKYVLDCFLANELPRETERLRVERLSESIH